MHLVSQNGASCQADEWRGRSIRAAAQEPSRRWELPVTVTCGRCLPSWPGLPARGATARTLCGRHRAASFPRGGTDGLHLLAPRAGNCRCCSCFLCLSCARSLKKRVKPPVRPHCPKPALCAAEAVAGLCWDGAASLPLPPARSGLPFPFCTRSLPSPSRAPTCIVALRQLLGPGPGSNSSLAAFKPHLTVLLALLLPFLWQFLRCAELSASLPLFSPLPGHRVALKALGISSFSGECLLKPVC